MDMKDYILPFLDETDENLQNLNELLLSLEQGDGEVIAEIFRIAHTLKGMSATMGFENMASLTHQMENVLDKVRNGELTLESQDISVLFSCLDTLTEIAERIREAGEDGEVDTSALSRRLEAIGSERQGGQAVAEDLQAASVALLEGEHPGYRMTVHFDAGCLLRGVRAFMVVDVLNDRGRVLRTEPSAEIMESEDFHGESFVVHIESDLSAEELHAGVMTVSEIGSCRVEPLQARCEGEEAVDRDEAVGAEGDFEPETEPVSPSEHDKTALVKREKPASDGRPSPREKGQQKVGQTVRVDVQRLDKLLNLVGELVIGRSRIERLARDSGLKEFEEPILQLGRISTEIQELVTKLRMVPVSFVFDRFPRLVRDLAQNLGKKVNLEIEGRDTELDRSVINEIGDPLVHLIRNSLDHAFEQGAERLDAGKPEAGRLRVRAYQDGSSVAIAVEDDGRGIDPEKVLRKAIEKGLISEDKTEDLTDREIFGFLFLPGFSTAEKVTDLSGRGVGMDAVKSKVEALGGRLMIDSAPGKGTSVKIKLPITLAIVLALIVKVNGQIYAIPLESVDETLLVQPDEVKRVNGSMVTMLRGSVLPLVEARSVYGLPEAAEKEESAVVVMRTGSRRVGFVVDDFVGQQEIVIKSLGKRGIAKVKWFSGGTILGDGSVALIIDPAAVDAGRKGTAVVQ